MATERIHAHGTVERRDDGSSDWNGRRIIRLDIRDGMGRDVHLYLPDGHQLGSLQKGDKLKIVQVD